jgi:predicted  nucleic acid-binding Zn-ribbon protein
MSLKLRTLFIIAIIPLLASCSNAYYSAMEKVGIHKRDIFIDRVEEATESQQKTKEQFKDALEKFSSVVNIQPSELRDRYDDLQDVYDASESQATDVKKRIAAVEDVANALFEEWAAEIQQYSSAALKRDSQQKYKATKRQYGQILRAMKQSEAKIRPVMAALKDQLLYLKHNLNAQAIAALKGELTSIKSNVNALIKDMEASINRSQSFIKNFKQD